MRYNFPYSYFAMGVTSQEIELSEALCGFRRVIKTLDKRELVITSHPGDVIKHGMCTYIGLTYFMSSNESH